MAKAASMTTNEEGEFELILGNKQLLSVFFIVIILLGVFFTMGYIVGRNSPAVTAAARTPAPAESASRSSAAGSLTPAEDAAATSVTQTAAEQTSASPKTVVIPVDTPLEIPPVAGGVREPQPGQLYVQVLAVPRAEADVLADVLRNKGMSTLVAAGPNERLFRVLIGPVKDTADAARVKGELEQAGFKDAFPKRY